MALVYKVRDKESGKFKAPAGQNCGLNKNGMAYSSKRRAEIVAEDIWFDAEVVPFRLVEISWEEAKNEDTL